MKSKMPGPIPAVTGPAVVPTPVTAADWQSRITALEADLSAAERTLVEHRAARRTAAGAALVFGGDDAVVAELEAIERDAERRVDSLKCAVALAQDELKKLVEAERQARIEAQRQRRQAVAREILAHAQHVDRHFETAAGHLDAITQLMVEYRQAGGAFTRSLKNTVTRAALAAMRPYIESAFVGGHELWRPLVEQLGALAVVPGADERLADREPAA